MVKIIRHHHETSQSRLSHHGLKEQSMVVAEVVGTLGVPHLGGNGVEPMES